MKISNLAVIFVLISICLFLPLEIEKNEIQVITNKQIEYNRAVDTAVDDAVYSLTEYYSGKVMKWNKEEAVENFFHTLYVNFGANTKVAQEKLRAYVPVLLLTEQDGFYVYYNQRVHTKKGEMIYQNWSEKYPYSYVHNDFVYQFTLGDFLRIYDKNENQILEGTYKDLKSDIMRNNLLKDETMYEEVKRSCIIQSIKETLTYYVNQHNKIAEFYNIEYNFSFPVIKKEDWYRTIDSVSFLAIFQGYPYGNRLGYYNRYAFGGARVRKTDNYYINSIDETLLYHKGYCNKVTDFSVPYLTKYECAKQGAYPCPDCNP